MSRTNRSHMTDANYREARKGEKPDYMAFLAERLPGADFPQPSVPWGTRHTRGGMMASSHNTGCWDDESTPDSGTLRSRERQAFRAALAAGEYDSDDVIVDPWTAKREADAEAQREYEAWLQRDYDLGLTAYDDLAYPEYDDDDWMPKNVRSYLDYGAAA